MIKIKISKISWYRLLQSRVHKRFSIGFILNVLPPM